MGCFKAKRNREKSASGVGRHRSQASGQLKAGRRGSGKWEYQPAAARYTLGLMAGGAS